MKKILLSTTLLLAALTTQGQHLYVQQIGNAEQVPFALADKPKITFGNGTKTINQTTFQLSEIQNLSFVKNSNSTSIATNFSNNKIQIHPNPVKDELSLIIENPQNVNYRIFDMNGKQLKANKINSETTTIQMQNFRTGIYILHVIQSGQKIQSFKIVKN
jgi:hypothetical protein